METAVLFFILATEPFLVYFKLFCFDKGLQFKPQHQNYDFCFEETELIKVGEG